MQIPVAGTTGIVHHHIWPDVTVFQCQGIVFSVWKWVKFRSSINLILRLVWVWGGVFLESGSTADMEEHRAPAVEGTTFRGLLLMRDGGKATRVPAHSLLDAMRGSCCLLPSVRLLSALSCLLVTGKIQWGESKRERQKAICNFDAQGAISTDNSWCPYPPTTSGGSTRSPQSIVPRSCL